MASLVTSLVAIVAYRRPRRVRRRTLPPYPPPETRPTPTLLLGEANVARMPGRVPAPTSLNHPRPSLYPGLMVRGPVVQEKTSALM